MSAPPDGETPSVGEPSSPTESQTDTSRDADVHAFLIADVRGWTTFTQERGDEDAARLAGRFAEVTRSVVEAHRGNVVELRGDEALVVFGSPRWAIRGAVALQQRFVEETIADPSLPLTVGIGLDAGEAVPVEGGYRGGALNVAARLCSLARAGEVLASREIVHLALRVDGIRFTERGSAELKGLDKPVHVVAVRSEDRDEAQAIAPFVRATAPPPRRRWKPVAAVVALAVVAALVVVPLVAQRNGSSEIAPNSIGVLDAASGEVTGTIELDDRPGSLAASEDAVWVTNPDAGTVLELDPSELAIVDTVQVGEDPTGIAVGFGAVWVLESGGPTVSRISTETGELVGNPIPVGNGPSGIAIGEGAVWVTNRFDGTVSRIDPNVDGEVTEFPVGLDPRGIAVGSDSVWVALAGSNKVLRVNPETNAVTDEIDVGNGPVSIAASDDDVWVANSLADTVSRIDPETSLETDVVSVGDAPSSVELVDGTVWVANEGDGTLSKIEPDQMSASTTAIESVPQGITGVSGDLWVSVRGTATSHQGGTLRIVSFEGPETIDPTFAYDNVSWRVVHLMGDGLVAFQPIGGTNPTLVPDLAESIPTPTDGGRTYRFELRPDIRYSNGEVVAPSDFLRAFERGARLSTDHDFLFEGLLGGQACVDDRQTCDLSRGIEFDDAAGTITFHLVDPDPDFLNMLSLAFAYPVPASVPEDEQAEEGIPGTGPYMLEAPMTDEGLALVRNPYFRVWSAEAQPAGYADKIEWRFGVEPEAQVDAVTRGDAELAFDAANSRQLDDILLRYPGQVHTSPNPFTSFVVLDSTSPPFDNLDVRRAVNFALDRRRVVEIFGGDQTSLPTCQQLPPNFPGYEPYCPYTKDPDPHETGSWKPDMAQAERLVGRSGTKGMRIAFEYPPYFWHEQGRLLGEYLVELLGDLGYRVSVRAVPLGQFYNADNEFQMALDGWGQDYPAASNFLLRPDRFACDTSWAPSAGLCDPQLDAAMERAARTQAADPIAAAALWAAIDRRIVDQAPYMWLDNSINIGFVSEEVGNYQFSPQWEVLLGQLWVR